MANQNLATQKAAMRLQVIMNPTLQDIVDSEDRYNALKDWLEKDGIKDPDRFCTNPVEIMQTQLAQMKQQAMQMQQQIMMMGKELEEGAKEMQKNKRTQKKVEAETSESIDTLGETIGAKLLVGGEDGLQSPEPRAS